VGYSGKHHINGIKRSLATDGNGHPLSVVIKTANVHDQKLMVKTLDEIRIGKRIRRPKRAGMDKGYDSNDLRKQCRKRHIVPAIIPRKGTIPHLTDRERKEQKYCRKRWRIERTFAWINVNRRIDKLLERKVKSYEMFIKLAFIRYYLKLVT